MPAFIDALTQVYLENPCRVLPNPLWKTLAELDHFRTTVEVGRDGLVKRLEAAGDDQLFVHWTREGRKPSLLMRRRLETMRRALVHQHYLDPDTTAGFATRLPFFRLIHRGDPAPPSLPPGYRFEAVDPTGQAQAVADFIAECYDDLKPAAGTVQNWSRHPVYAPDLWAWVVNEQIGERAALVIGELDPAIGEMSLEWVQVRSAYRGKGLGKAAVLELLRRAAGRAAFTTVSGPVENRDKPGGFYRACGFTGYDVWWLLADPFR
ncbi:MAG: N-acetyltransferase [Chloroflexi bacterium]|nr:N-acetyltransferase [Chloroflexota bacterium]MDL1882423.1 GNAT family N-acetyltransferase [Anaerolineae bacterium CFX8]